MPAERVMDGDFISLSGATTPGLDAKCRNYIRCLSSLLLAGKRHTDQARPTFYPFVDEYGD